MPEDLLILDEIKCNVSSPRSFRIDKYFTYFFLSRGRRELALQLKIFMFIVNTFLIRSEYNKVRVEMIKHILQLRRTRLFSDIF